MRPSQSENIYELQNDQDTYHFLLDKRLGSHKWAEFRSFYIFKKVAFTKPKVSEEIEEYRSIKGASPILRMKFSEEFIDFMEKKYKNKPKDQEKLMILFKKINENNEIYKYIQERVKDPNLTKKELAESVFGGETMIQSYIRQIQDDEYCRNEIMKLGSESNSLMESDSDREQVLDPKKMLSYWDAFITQHPHHTRNNRFQQFAEFLEKNCLYALNSEKQRFREELRDTMKQIGPDELHNLYFYYRYIQNWKTEEVARYVYSSPTRSFYVKMGYTETEARKVKPQDFAHLEKFLELIKDMELSELYNNRNLVEEYKHGTHKRPIYDKKMLHPSFVEFVEEHEEFHGTKDKHVEQLIYWARNKSGMGTIEDDLTQSDLNLTTIPGTNLLNRTKTNTIENPPEEVKTAREDELRIYEKSKLNEKIMAPDQLSSIITRTVGEHKVREIQNYLEFLRVLKSDGEIQQYWWEYDAKKRPFECRMANFALFLERNYLVVCNEKYSQFRDLVIKINNTQQANKYVLFLYQKGLNRSEIAKKIYMTDDGVGNIIKRSENGVRISRVEVEHVKRFLELLTPEMVEDYQKNYCDPSHNSIFHRGKVLPRFMEFTRTRIDFQDTKGTRKNVEQFISLLRTIEHNKESEKLLQILGKETRLYLTDIAKALLLNRATLRRLYQRDMEKKAYDDRFERELTFNNVYHQTFEHLMVKVFREHPELGTVYQEPYLYKPENAFQIDSLIIASADLQQRVEERLVIKNARFLLVDYTNNYKDEYLLEKMLKYAPKDDAALLIVGMDWPWNRSSLSLPITDLFGVHNSERIKIINVEKFASILGIPIDKNDKNWSMMLNLATSKRFEEIEETIDSLEEYSDLKKSTEHLVEDLVATGELKNDQLLSELFLNYDIETVDDTILTLRELNDIKPLLLELLKTHNALRMDEIQKFIPRKNTHIRRALASLEKKGEIQYIYSHTDTGLPIKLYFLPENTPPQDPYNEKRRQIKILYKLGKKAEEIYEIANVSPKFYRKVVQEEKLGKRPNIQRIQADFCYKAVREKWNLEFLYFILNLKQFRNLEKLVKYTKDSHGYFDETDPLTQDEVFNGIKMKRQSILSLVTGMDKKIMRIYYKTIKMLKNNPKSNLEKFSHQFILNAEDKIDKEYGLDEYWHDFQRLILEDIKNFSNMDIYWQMITSDSEHINEFEEITRKRQIKLDPNSDTGIIIKLVLNNPKLSINELHKRVKDEINKGTLKMKQSSKYNIIKKAIEYTDKILNEMKNKK